MAIQNDKYTNLIMLTVCYYCPISTKIGTYRQISVEITYVEASNFFSGSNRDFRGRWTNKQPPFEIYLPSHIKTAFYKILKDNQPLFSHTELTECSSLCSHILFFERYEMYLYVSCAFFYYPRG